MFFETSRFGCCKMNFDAMKDTYSMYSCTIIGMSREMMKMDDRRISILVKEGRNGHYGI